MILTACFMLRINNYMLIQAPGIESKLWILRRKEPDTRNVSLSVRLSKEMLEQKMTYIPNNKRLEERR